MPDDYVPFTDDTMGGVGDYLKLQQLYDEVEQLIDELREYEYQAAERESEYRMLVSAKTAQERMMKVPVTVISDLVRGDEEIANKHLLWKKAEADANATKHQIFLAKDKMSMLTEIIKHEMYRPSNG